MEILIWMLFGAACYVLAEQKGKNPILWAILGALFGIFALIVLALMKSEK